MVIPEFNLAELSLRVIYLKTVRGVCGFLSATASTILQSELVLSIAGYMIHSDKKIIVVELFDAWKVSVLVALDRIERL